MGSLRSGLVNSMHLMLRLAHRNTYLGENNNRGRGGTSNDNAYCYCSKDVGEVVNQPHTVCFPLLCLASPVICQSSVAVFFDGSFPFINQLQV